MLEDLVLAAVTDGLRRSHDIQQESLGGVTGGLDLGALGDPAADPAACQRVPRGSGWRTGSAG